MRRLLFQSVLSWPTHVTDLCHVQPWSAHSCCSPHSNPSLCQDAGACAVFPPSPHRACASKPAGCSAQAITWFYTLLNWLGKWKCLQPCSKRMSSNEGFIKLESTDDKSFSFSAFSLYFLLLNRKTTSYTSTRSPLLKATSWPQMVWFMLWAPSCSLRVGWCLEVLRATPSQQNCHQKPPLVWSERHKTWSRPCMMMGVQHSLLLLERVLCCLALWELWSLHLCFRKEQLLHFIVNGLGFSTRALKYCKEGAWVLWMPSIYVNIYLSEYIFLCLVFQCCLCSTLSFKTTRKRWRACRSCIRDLQTGICFI